MDYQQYRKQIYELNREVNDNIARVFRPCGDAFGLTYTQYQLLSELDRAKALTVGELGRRLRMRTNISTMCKKLEQSGYLARTRSPEDERVVLVALTDGGQAALAGVNRELNNRYAHFWQSLPAREADRIIQGLCIMNQFYSRIIQAEESACSTNLTIYTDRR